MTFSSPPQFRQCSRSSNNTRLSSRAQLSRIDLWCAQFGSQAAGCDAFIDPARSDGTTITRILALGATMLNDVLDAIVVKRPRQPLGAASACAPMPPQRCSASVPVLEPDAVLRAGFGRRGALAVLGAGRRRLRSSAACPLAARLFEKTRQAQSRGGRAFYNGRLDSCKSARPRSFTGTRDTFRRNSSWTMNL
jgi:hypothetical protein